MSGRIPQPRLREHQEDLPDAGLQYHARPLGQSIYSPSRPACEVFLTGVIAPSLQTASEFHPLVVWPANIDRRCRNVGLSAQPPSPSPASSGLDFGDVNFSHVHHRGKVAFGFSGSRPVLEPVESGAC